MHCRSRTEFIQFSQGSGSSSPGQAGGKVLLGTALSIAASTLPPREAPAAGSRLWSVISSAEWEGFYQPQAQGSAPR